MPVRQDIERLLTFRGRVAPSVGLVITGTVATSLLAALGAQFGLPLFELAALVPGRVWAGEIWRLLTWILVEPDPTRLVFAVLICCWLARDLCAAWGPRRFLLVCLGLVLVASVGTTLPALAWPLLLRTVHVGLWPVVDGLMVAWALLYPGRKLMFWFAIPMTSQILLYVTIGGTVLFAIFQGLALFLPHLLAELTALAYLRARTVRRPT